jgi:peptide/nickel transport system substrate-binding protein
LITRRKLLRLSALGALAVVCTPATPTGQGPAPTGSAATAQGPIGTATVVQGPPVISLDTTVERALTYRNASFHLYETLLARDDDMRLVSLLATSYVVSPDGKAVRFKLRPGVKFHDGTTFSAEDAKWSLDRARDPATRQGPKASDHAVFLTAVTETKVVDPETLDVLLSRPDATFLLRLDAIPMVSKAWVAANGAAKLVSQEMGTGPFKLKSWVVGQDIVMEANPDYWGTPPRIKTVIWKSIPEATTRVAALQTDAAQVVVGVPADLAKQVTDGGQAGVDYVHQIRNLWITQNAYKKPYSDVRVRKALNHALNVDLYIRTILGGHALRTAASLGPLVFGFNPKLTPYAYDPEKAKALLADAGYPTGFKATLMFRTDGQVTGEPEIAQAVAADLGKVGVEVKLIPADFRSYVDKYAQVLNMDADLFFDGNANATADADNGLTSTVYSKAKSQDRIGHYWPTPKDVDDAIIKARSVVDVKEREALYNFVLQRLYDEAVFLFMFDTFQGYGVSKRLQGLRVLADESVQMHRAQLRT